MRSRKRVSIDLIEKRLLQVFVREFPGLFIEEARLASKETVEEWDSLATFILFMLCTEELGVELGSDQLHATEDFKGLASLLFYNLL